LQNSIAVLGLGTFGSTIAKEFGEQNYEVVAIDKNIDNVNRVEAYVVQAVHGDFTDIELLKKIGVGQCDVVVIGTGSNLESSVLAIMACKKLKVPNIVAKSKNKVHMEIMREVGAHKIIRPEKEMGMRFARNLMRNHILDVIELDENTAIIEFNPPKKWINKTISQLNIRQKYDLNIIGIRENKQKEINYQLSPEEMIKEDNVLLALGEPKKFEHLDYTNQLK